MSNIEHLKFLARLKFGLPLSAHQNAPYGNWYISSDNFRDYIGWGCISFTTEEEAWEHALTHKNQNN